tara:strand:- start:704 stop:838 length:135 start_codon:yes stop_codon:yes gene_type:complete
MHIVSSYSSIKTTRKENKFLTKTEEERYRVLNFKFDFFSLIAEN